jgi:hypothetical protein
MKSNKGFRSVSRSAVFALVFAMVFVLSCKYEGHRPKIEGTVSITMSNPVLNEEALESSRELPPSRTVVPSNFASMLYYKLAFTSTSGEDPVNETLNVGSVTKTVSLAAGEWTVAIEAYPSQSDATYLSKIVATGSASFTIEEGSTTQVPITLAGKADSGAGIFSYTVTFSGVELAAASLSLDPSVSGSPAALHTGANTGSINLAAGFYTVTVAARTSADFTLARQDLVHIYNGITTSLAWAFTGDNFAEPDTDVPEPGTGEGNARITLAYTEQGGAAFSQSSFTVTRETADSQKTVSLASPGDWTNPTWKVDNGAAQAGTSIIIDAADYTPGGHSLLFTGTYTDSVPWSRQIDFTVEGSLQELAGFYEGVNTEPTDVSSLTGTGGTGLIAKSLTWLTNNASANGDYTIKIDTGETLNPVMWYSIITASNVTLTIKGLSASAVETAWPVVQSSGNGLFELAGVASPQKLILDGRVILKGNTSTHAIVSVETRGTVEMKGNAKITGNGDSYGYGGGVMVTNGIFIMSGNASVSGNAADKGGGVYVGGNTAVFTMSGNATVSGNTASNGGGVYLDQGGSFEMSGGSISGNTVTGYGGGVYVYPTDTTFTKTGGVIYGSGGTGHNAVPNNHTAGNANRDDCNIAATDGHALAKESGTLTIGEVTAQYFNSDLGETQNTP